ncbi:MAG: hypothetical protein K9J16_08670 [Melioribacteraceae bacterium]|nr:hypothetical protein [Melioribacteraceae bacterium]MCF8353782.1 hypothetical protein [Melioribacteraceae bacterium]MCF8393618.1 hypothetical protein [Melioribacteraceae bacterium]MCF8419428.1 hypothetical protein [Melioribacteraceae bacterium]
MWKVIKFDLLYYKKIILISGIFFLVMLAIFSLSDGITEFKSMYVTLGLAVWISFFGRWGHFMFNRDNIERVQSQLPLKRTDLAKARILIGLLIWAFYLSSYLISVFSSSYERSGFTIWSVITFNGIVVIINVMPLLWHDYIFIGFGKHRKLIAYIFYIPIVIGVIFAIYFTTSLQFEVLLGFQSDMRQELFRPFPALLFNIFGAALTYIGYRLYMMRHHYLTSEFGIRSNIKVKTGDIT